MNDLHPEDYRSIKMAQYNGLFKLRAHSQYKYYQNSTVILLMKNRPKLNFKHAETNLETDIDESSPLCPFSRRLTAQKAKKKVKRTLKNSSTPTYYQKIMRFQLKHLGRTLRIPCYEEASLNLPVRFTRKLNAMEVDNDVETDEEVVEGEIERCCGWLKEAIAANAGSPSKQP